MEQNTGTPYYFEDLPSTNNTFQQKTDELLGWNKDPLDGQQVSPVIETRESGKRDNILSKIMKSAKSAVNYLTSKAAPYAVAVTLLSGCITVVQTVEQEKTPISVPTPTPTSDLGEATVEEVYEEEIPGEEVEEYITTATPEGAEEEEITTETPEEVVEEEIGDKIPYVPTEKNEAFDMEATNLFEYEITGFERDVIPVSETVVTATDENHLYIITSSEPPPTRRDLGTVTKLTLPAGYTFNIKEIVSIEGNKGEEIMLGVVEDSFASGVWRKLVLLLNATDQSGEVQGFVKKQEKNTNIVTFLTNEGLDVVSEVEGELLMLQKISEYQESIGGFVSGEEISLNNIVNPTSETFVITEDAFGKPFYSGTEFFASTLKRLAEKEDSSIVISDGTGSFFGLAIMPGPYAFPQTSTRWSTAIGPEDDLVFQIKENSDNPNTRFYFEFQPIFANIDFSKLDYSLEGADYSKIIHGATVRLVTEKPEGQEEILSTLLANYKNYIANGTYYPMVIPQAIKSEKYNLTEKNIKSLIGLRTPFPPISIGMADRWRNSRGE